MYMANTGTCPGYMYLPCCKPRGYLGAKHVFGVHGDRQERNQRGRSWSIKASPSTCSGQGFDRPIGTTEKLQQILQA